MALNSKQQLFVDEYLKTYNATKSALAAGYSENTGYAHGHKLLKNAEISAIISQRLSETAMSANEVIKRLGEHARGTFEPFLTLYPDGETIAVNLTTEKAQAHIHLIKKISQRKVTRTKGYETTEDVTLTIEIHDPQAALNTLAKHHGLLTDKTEITGAGGSPIQQKLIIEYVTVEDNVT